MKRIDLAQIAATEAVNAERNSWKPKASVFYRINTIVNGYGLSREIKELSDDGYSGVTEAQALAMAKKLKSKGFEVQLYRIEHQSQRIV